MIEIQTHQTHFVIDTQIVIGVDNAGKTTISSALRGKVIEESAPTWGLNEDTVHVGKVSQRYPWVT